MTFLFDIGRVLLDFDFETSLARLVPADEVDLSARLHLLLERKDEFETGAITADEYTAWALQTLGSLASAADFHHAWQQIFTPNEPMWQSVRKLAAAGHRLILFSNINSIHAPWIFEEFPEFALFEGAVLSFQAGAIKPHPEIYHHAISRYELTAEDTLYIDDLPLNIATGERLGFRTFHYDLKDHNAFEMWLNTQLEASI
jgi:glucose-1-phosphatase